ncbi:MAG: winged helix-turn-helix domain-containing protein, partial [Gallionella sp.]|nr:winged helix-turn-helix domain-containing protein [Gallionella sp.]
MQSHSNQNLSPRPNYWGRYENDRPISLGALHLCPATNLAQVGDVAMFLRPMEFRLLHFFMNHPDKVHTRAQLLEQVWG